MTKIRPSKQYRLTRHEFMTAYHFALQYPEWKSQYTIIAGVSGVAYDGMPHGSSNGNPTEKQAMRLYDLDSKINVIESTVKEVDEGGAFYKWFIKGFTQEGITGDTLVLKYSMPCSRATYYRARQKFFYLLSEKIGAKNDR